MRTNTFKPVEGDAGNDKMYIVTHPRKRDRILLMDAASSYTQYSDNGGATWIDGPLHPFAAQLDSTGEMSVTGIPNHGLVMGVTHKSSPAGESRCCFWRPAI